MKNKRIRGEHAHLNVSFIAELFGISVSRTRRYLKKHKVNTIDDLGELVWEIRTIEKIKFTGRTFHYLGTDWMRSEPVKPKSREV